MSTIADQLDNYSIYITLSIMGNVPGFHWGFFIPTSSPRGEIWHAINTNGTWSLENKMSDRLPSSPSLCNVMKVGIATTQNWDVLRETLEKKVPSSGYPSLNTGEAFSCRVWIKDALLALHNAGVIQLIMKIADIENIAVTLAESNRTKVQTRTGTALVYDRTGFTTATR